ncbi:AfsR/SARP family transcriptional regulator [Amycolatopsis anabasis]|uniref:AfsR/SARP family transcriptional regulator n=1 Tax=Amycolatopsis anabasis TaxID=1840409 RepID=UPI001FE9F5A4|nr:BTAD domain-containing putative transcriptional regulator [Amycolatopsis anabasis]
MAPTTFEDKVPALDHGVVPMTGSRLRLSVLGPMRAWRGGEQLDLGPVRQQALLAALVLRPGLPVNRQELLDGVWGLEPPATNVVPVYVYRLRKCLRPGGGPQDSMIDRDRSGYRFVGEGVRVDATRLEELAAEAGTAKRAGDLAAAVDKYTSALELFRGEPLAGLPGPFAEGQRRRLTERRIALLQEKLEWQLLLGRHAAVIGELSALTSAHPHHEPLAALLMRALHDSGRQADALAVFTRQRRRLVEDLGVEPGEVLRRAHRAVLRGESDLGAGAARSKAS